MPISLSSLRTSFTSSVCVAFLLIVPTACSASEEVDYKTTVDFIITHGSGWQGAERVVLEEAERCQIKSTVTNFEIKSSEILSYTVDPEKPTRHNSFYIPFGGIKPQEMKHNMGDRFVFKTVSGHSIRETVEILRLKKQGFNFFSDAIYPQIEGKKIKVGDLYEGLSQEIRYMVPGSENEVHNKYRPLLKAFTRLAELCGSKAPDFGVFGDEIDEIAEEEMNFE